MNTRHITTRIVLAAASTALLLGAAACGDDDDDDDAAPATTEASADTAAATPDTTAAAAADPAAFCDAFVAANAAAMSEDPAIIGPAFDAAIAAAPADIKPTVETLIASSEEQGPEFETAFAETVGYVKENCGFNEINVTTKEYSFEGLPREVPAGNTVVTMDNQGTEFHEVLMLKVNDGVTDTPIDLLALPEEELMTKASIVSVTFGPPGVESYGIAELAPGRYIAACFLPQGATPEVMAQLEGPDSSLPPGVGPEHFMEGMVQEFNVA